MADTIITNTPDKNGNDSGAAGWLVALVVIIAVIVGGVLLYQKGVFNPAPAAPAEEGTTNINVVVPNPLTSPDAGEDTAP